MRWLSLILLALSLIAVAAPAAADPPGAEAERIAGEHFERGVQFYKERDFRNALIEFKRAYETLPSYGVLYNIGQASFELKEYVEAQRAFTTYLEQGGAELDAVRRAEVQGELERLKNYVARLHIQVNVDGAEVAVDDVVVGVTPLAAPVTVSAGRRTVSARKSGYAPLTREFDIGGGAEHDIALELTSLEVRTVPVPTPVPPPSEEEAEDEGAPVAFWISLATTAAFGVATGVCGGLALAAKSDHDDLLDTFPITQEAIDDSAGKVRTLAALTDVMAALTGGGVIVTVLVGISELTDDEEDDAALRLRLGPTSVGVSGAF